MNIQYIIKLTPLYTLLILSCSLEPRPSYQITTAVIPSGGGTVTHKPDQELIDEMTFVEFVATPSQGYRFKEWGGDLEGDINTKVLCLTSDVDVTAVFEKTCGSLGMDEAFDSEDLSNWEIINIGDYSEFSSIPPYHTITDEFSNDGTSNVQLRWKNFRYTKDSLGLGSYTFKARTNSVRTSGLNGRENLSFNFLTDKNLQDGLSIGIRPNGTDDPGWSINGLGIDFKTNDAPVQAFEWFDVEVIIDTERVQLYINEELLYQAPFPVPIEQSQCGFFSFGATYGRSASFDNIRYQ